MRDLFSSEAAECLAVMERHLLLLEQAPLATEQLHELFRAVHTLKGAAGMLGVIQVESLAHALESVFAELRQGTRTLGSEHSRVLLALLDDLKGLVERAVHGTGAAVNLTDSLARAEGLLQEPGPPAAPAPARRAPPAPSPAEPSGELSARLEEARLDEILSLTGELLAVGSRLEARQREAGVELEDVLRLRRLTESLSEAVQRLRLQSVEQLFKHLPRVVRDLAVGLGKEVKLSTSGTAARVDRSILAELRGPLTQLVRNALDHGLEPPDERRAAGKPPAGRLELRARREGNALVIEVEDDGRGLNLERIRETAARKGLRSEQDVASLSPEGVANLIFLAGFSTAHSVTETSGRGVGLDIVRSQVDRLKGSVEVDSRPGQGCLFRLRTSLTVTATRVVLVKSGGRWLGVPLEEVEAARLVWPADVLSFPGGNALEHAGELLSLVSLAALAGLPLPDGGDRPQPCLILRAGAERAALLVEQVLEEHDLLVKPFEPPLKRVRYWRGAALLPQGSICLIMRTSDVVRAETPPPAESSRAPLVQRILLVEDSLTTRVQEKRILEGAGYEVVTAVDGLDALEKLAQEPVDAVVSDVEMPNMDGFELTRRLRADARWLGLPVVLVTSLSSEADRRRGLEAGANAYIPKPSFTQSVLLTTLARCL